MSGSGWKSTDVDDTTALHGIACSSTTSCLAIDGEGNVFDLTLDASGEATVSKHDIDGTNDLVAISCVGFTCTTVDAQGDVFVSGNGGASWMKELDTATDLTSVSCASSALCVTADKTGNVTVFEPAVVSVEPCGGGGALPQGGGYEVCAAVDPHGTTVEGCQFEVGRSPQTYTSVFPCESAPLSGKKESVEVTAKLEGLEPDATYYYRLSMMNTSGTESGPEEQFSTEPVAPTVIGESVSGLTENYATLQAQTNPGGQATYYAEYGTSACEADSCGTRTSEGFLLGDTQETVTLAANDLKPNTTYHYWIVAVNGAAPAGVHGQAEEFTTPRSWEEIRNQEDEQLLGQKAQEEAKGKAEAEARAATAAKEHQEEEVAASAAKKKHEEEAAGRSVSVKIVKVEVGSGGVTVTLDASRAGTATISGPGLKTRVKNIAAGSHRIRVSLTKTGKRDRVRHEKIELTVRLKTAGRTALGSKTVRL